MTCTQAGADHGRHPVEEDNRRAHAEGKIDHVIGVDTHRDTHAAAVLDRNGGLIAQLEVPANQAGYARLLGVVVDRAPGRRCWALEGTSCYGAGLASFLAAQGEWVTEIDRPKRPRGRNGAKSDPLDAVRAGREALRVLQLTRGGAVKVTADGRRHLKALLVTAPEPLRAALQGRTWLQQARACAALQAKPAAAVEDQANVLALQLTAERVLRAHVEAKMLEKELRALVATMAPVLLSQPGVGPITAAQLLISWSHPGRLRSEAAFAMLAGAAPVEASSGQVVRHRLNRGGDRQLNRALHTIVMIRQRYHQPTKAYTTRRCAEGKTQRDVRRCLIGGLSRSRLEGRAVASR